MFNHVRTLLMNRGPDGFSPISEPGEELVPAYTPRALNGVLATAHQFLLGTHPDRLFLNFRLSQLMGWLHASNLAEFITVRDTRLTYLPLSRDVAGWFISRVSNDAVQIHRTPVCDDGRGWTTFRYQLTRADAVLTIQQLAPAAKQWTTELAFSGGLSAPIALPDSQSVIRVMDALPGSTTLVLRAKPQTDLGRVLTAWASLYGEPLAGLVFQEQQAPLPQLEPYWRLQPNDTERYAALLLGFAYYLEHQPTRG